MLTIIIGSDRRSECKLGKIITSSLNAQYTKVHDIFWRVNCSWAGTL